MFEGFIRTEIETGSARIHLRHGGKGPPLLLLHGNPPTHVSWHGVANRLAEHLHVYAPTCAATVTALAPRMAAITISTTRSGRWRWIRWR